MFVPIPPLQPPFYSRDVSEMYDGILHKPLPLPPGKSEAVSSLLVGLLQKDQHRRLGAIADFVSVLCFKKKWFPRQEIISLILEKGCFSKDFPTKLSLVEHEAYTKNKQVWTLPENGSALTPRKCFS